MSAIIKDETDSSNPPPVVDETGEGGDDAVGIGSLIPASANGDDTAAKKRPVKPKAGKVVKKVRKVIKKRRVAREDPLAAMIKYGALFLLVAQMVGLVMVMRYSRTIPRDPGEPLYLASTAVCVQEIMKFVICCLVITAQTGGDLLGELHRHLLQSPMEVAKVSVPALLYTVQNNLLYLALSNLDAVTYQVCYQLKVLTTALFSVILLQRKFSTLKWISLVTLTVGVAIVNISKSGDAHHHTQDDASNKHNRFVGLVAVLCAACTSGFAGVYFEKILKGSTTTLWVRNVQMALPSIIISMIAVFAKDGAEVGRQGFFGGYSAIVWTVVTVQAAGGLIVAVVVKYADNVLKVFATSFSIVISGIISWMFFQFHATYSFVLGASLVVLATAMYSQPEGRKTRGPILPVTAKD